VQRDEDDSVQRRNSHLGLGLGYATTTSVVEEVFGEGSAGSIYVNQRIYKIFGIRLLYGGIYLGSPEETASMETYLKGLDFFGSSFRNFSMTFSYITIGPTVQLHFGERHSVMLAGSWGLYDVKLDLASITAYRLSPKNDRTGFNVGAMYCFWIGDSWGLDARVEYHLINTTDEPDDLYYVFVRGDQDPSFFNVLIGVHIGYR
jgi:hypothetical protein